ncbi:MAG: TIGR00341 family protein [Phycisphaerales bacterium]|nr:MAG: TIGR00341 family protein [Phycisphaerales bacterium]
MMVLLYERDDDSVFRESVLPLFKSESPESVVFDPDAPPEIEAGATVVAYMSDALLARLLPIASERKWRVGLLPHPKMPQGRLGIGVAAKLEDAASDILSAEAESQVDLLYCNGEAVLNSVVIGDPFAEAPGASGGGTVPDRVIGIFKLLGKLRAARPQRFKISTAKDKQLETLALGIVAVEHGRSALLSRRLLEDSSVNDGMLHALIYAPRSVLAMLRFQFGGMFMPRPREGRSLPPFVGHIKTESLKVTAARAVGYSIDGRSRSESEIELTVAKRAIWLVLGRHIETEETTQESKEVFRVSGLPTGDVLGEMKDRPLPWINHASPSEFKDLFQILRDNGRTSESYIILTVLSTLLATFGLFADSAPVIIGAMILAPLMSPIVAMGMGVLRRGEQVLLKESVKAFVIGVGLVLLCSILVAWLTPLRTVNDQITARLNPTLLDMGVAVFSGIAGAYAHARAEVARSLAGVAIAVALVPPLSVAGIGIGWWDWHVFSAAGLLFITNFAGMVLAAAGTFLALGYSPFTYSKRGLAASIATFIAVTLLLVPGFVRMVDEHRIIRQIDGYKWEGVELRDVRLRSGRPVHVSATVVAGGPVSAEQIETIKAELEDVIRRPIRFEATSAIFR